MSKCIPTSARFGLALKKNLCERPIYLEKQSKIAHTAFSKSKQSPSLDFWDTLDHTHVVQGQGICTCAARRIGAPLSACKSIAEQCSSALTGAKRLCKGHSSQEEREREEKGQRNSHNSSKSAGAFCTKLYYYYSIILGKAALESCTNSLLLGASDFSRNTL